MDELMIERIRYLVLAAQREGHRWLAAELSSLGVTPSQGEVLQVLDDHGPLSLSGLGELLVCESGTNPSRLVARLIDAGFIRRGSVPGDARLIRLSLTPAGRAKSGEVAEVESRLHARLGETLDGKDIGAVVEALESVVQGTPAGEAITRRPALRDAAQREAEVVS